MFRVKTDKKKKHKKIKKICKYKKITYLRVMETIQKSVRSVQGAPPEKKVRAKTASFTAEQIRKIGKSEQLAETIAKQIDESDGNLKGTIAFQVADMFMRQTKIKM